LDRGHAPIVEVSFSLNSDKDPDSKKTVQTCQDGHDDEETDELKIKVPYVRPDRSKMDHVASFFRNITIEPPTFCFCFAMGIFYIISPELMIQKVIPNSKFRQSVLFRDYDGLSLTL
jgi:hypothetical protein